MSKAFISLVKIQLRNVMMSMFGRSKKSGKGTFLASLLFPAGISMYLSGVYAIAMGESLPLEYMYFIPVMGIGLGLFFTCIFTFYSASGIFKSKDYELLCSLPYSKHEIFFAKLLSLYLYAYIYVFFFMLIPLGMYFAKVGFSFSILLWTILQSLCVPFFPIMVSTLFAMLITYISSFFRNTSFIQIVLYIGIIAIIFLGSSFLQSDAEMALDVQVITSTIKQYMYPLYCYLMSVKLNSALYAIQFMGMFVGAFAIFVGVFAHFFDTINKSLLRTKTKANGRVSAKSITTNGVSKALFKRELSRYLQTPIYVMNTSVGPLMLLIGAIVLYFQKEQIGIMAIYLGGNENVMLILAMVIILMLSITTTTSCSISLEGKYLWISKTLPVSTEQLFQAKLWLSILVEYPLSFLALLIFSYILHLSFPIIILYAVFLLIVSLHSSVLGLIVNLHFPKLDYLNETAVVKQSAAVAVFMLCGVVSVILLGGLSYLLYGILDYIWIIVVIGLLLVFIEIMEYQYLIRKGTRMFESL